jgi:hypothetical protein
MSLSSRCTVLNITGFSSPHKDDVIDTNDRCDPAMTSYVEFADCGGAVLDEQPAKTAEAIRLFLQGLGHSKWWDFIDESFANKKRLVAHMSIPRFSIANRLTEQTAEYKRRHDPLVRGSRRGSAPFDAVDSGLYRNDSQDEEEEEAGIIDNERNDYEHELQLRVDSFDDRNVKL